MPNVNTILALSNEIDSWSTFLISMCDLASVDISTYCIQLDCCVTNNLNSIFFSLSMSELLLISRLDLSALRYYILYFLCQTIFILLSFHLLNTSYCLSSLFCRIRISLHITQYIHTHMWPHRKQGKHLHFSAGLYEKHYTVHWMSRGKLNSFIENS